MILERACIVPAFPKPVERDAEEWYVHISLSNVGRSFGIVKGLFVRFAEPGALPAMPPSEGYEERPTDTVLRIGVENWNGLAPFKMPSKREGQIIYGYIRYEDVFGRIWRNRFACEVWSEETRYPRDFCNTGPNARRCAVSCDRCILLHTYPAIRRADGTSCDSHDLLATRVRYRGRTHELRNKCRRSLPRADFCPPKSRVQVD